MAHASISLRGKARFGPFQANLRTAELRKYDLPVKLAGRPFEILALLLEARGEIVTREEIRARLWPPDTFVDFENNINTAIGKLRSVLGDSAATPRYIETAGRGYRFMASIEWLVEEQPSSPSLPAFAPPTPEPVDRAQTRRPWLLGGAAVLAVVASTLLFLWLRPSRQPIPGTNGRTMIAILPFQNLTGDDSQDFLSDGLTEEIIAQVGSLQSPNMGVIANTSVMHYKRSRASLDQIGRELGVQYVMEGGVRRDGDRVRVTADLIEMQHKTQIWSRQYDRERTGLLALQGEIAQQIAYEVHSTFVGVSNGGPASVKQNYPSYESYLKGEYFFHQRTSASITQAIAYFEQAIEQDPSNARAYASLADAYTLLPGYAGKIQFQDLDKALDAAEHAVKLEPSLPEAHAALALTAEHLWDWDTAEREFRRAISLNPSYATAHHWYAEHLSFRGRFDEALHESQIARQLDPLSLIIAADEGEIFFFARRYDEAIARWQSVLAMDPNFSRAQLIVGAYTEQGRYAEALKFLEKQRPLFNDVWYIATASYIAARSGDRPRAQRELKRLLSLYQQKPFDPRLVARAYIGLGDKDRAITYLERACEQHSVELTSLYVNPEFDTLRSEPRFQKLLARVHLP